MTEQNERPQVISESLDVKASAAVQASVWKLVYKGASIGLKPEQVSVVRELLSQRGILARPFFNGTQQPIQKIVKDVRAKITKFIPELSLPLMTQDLSGLRIWTVAELEKLHQRLANPSQQGIYLIQDEKQRWDWFYNGEPMGRFADGEILLYSMASHPEGVSEEEFGRAWQEKKGKDLTENTFTQYIGSLRTKLEKCDLEITRRDKSSANVNKRVYIVAKSTASQPGSLTSG